MRSSLLRSISFCLLAVGICARLAQSQVTSGAPATQPNSSVHSTLTTPASALLTREQILASVESARAKVQDLTVSFSFNATHSEPDDPVFRQHDRAAVKGSKLRIERQSAGDPATKARMFTREVGFDGQGCIIFQKDQSTAVYFSSKSPECTVADLGFFQCGLLLPPSGNDNNIRASLQSLLKNPNARLRDKLEMMNGVPCYVLDIGNANDSPSLQMTAWLDPTKGFLPAKASYFWNPAQPAMETYIDQAQEVIPGVWLPMHGRKVLNEKLIDNGNQIDSKPSPGISEYILEVDGWKEGHPSIAVNAGIKDDYFDLWKHLPVGTRLFKDVGRKSKGGVIVTGDNEKALEDVVGLPVSAP